MGLSDGAFLPGGDMPEATMNEAVMGGLLDRISWGMAVAMAALLGLAPFVPEPHVMEKATMLAAGQLTQLIDVGDLMMHAAPWLLLAAKVARLLTTQAR